MMLKRLVPAIVLLTALVACSNCVPWQRRVDAVPGGDFKQVYRVFVTCMEGLEGGGTAAAVDGRHLITARHVAEACEQNGQTTWKITAKASDGATYEVVLDKHAKSGADASRLVIVGTEEPFIAAQWTDNVRVDEYVCSIGLDSNDMGLAKECGIVSEVGWKGTKYIKVTAHWVPGFSGGSVWDENGNSIGIVSRGTWSADRSWLVLVVPISEFRDLLVVDYSPDMN